MAFYKCIYILTSYTTTRYNKHITHIHVQNRQIMESIVTEWAKQFKCLSTAVAEHTGSESDLQVLSKRRFCWKTCKKYMSVELQNTQQNN